MGGAGRHQAYLAVNAPAQVPALRRLLGVIAAHGNDVRTKAQVRREFIHEADVAVRPAPQMVPVDPDIAVGHHAVEHDEAAFCAIDFCDLERVAVPADPAKKKAAGRTGRIVDGDRTLDRVVMRDRDRAPGAVVKTGLLSALRIAFRKTPAVREQFD